MIGTHQVRVSRRRGTSFRFEVRRNVTIVRGDSGTGKTTLYEMVADHTRLGDASGVSVQCDKPCVALTDIDWQNQLEQTRDSIVFVDEGFEPLASEAFARAAFGSSNYFVIFSRSELCNLPYSVNEVYRIKTSGKFHTFEPLYKRKEGERYSLSRVKPKGDFDVLLTEDSKSGFQFFSHRFEDGKLRVETSASNSKIMTWLLDHSDERVFVVADGAAFGPYADRVLKLQREHPENITVCLPESFEWLLLKSGIVKSEGLGAILEDPSVHIESANYATWERFFASLLVELTRGTPFAYKKGELAEAYLVPANASRAMALIACRNVR